jgi:hypothetical protein
MLIGFFLVDDKLFTAIDADKSHEIYLQAKSVVVVSAQLQYYEYNVPILLKLMKN